MGKYFAVILAVGAGFVTALAILEAQKSAEREHEEYFKAYHDHHQNFELQEKYGDDFHIVYSLFFVAKYSLV